MKTTRILYVDDELDLLDLAAAFFDDESLPIETCSEFDDALKRIRENHYDLIISDAKLPTGSGHELRNIIRSEKLFSGKFILVTGNIENFGEEQKSDFDLVVYKPIHFQELITVVKKLLLD